MVKVLWFSRHEMTAEQFGSLEAKLGPIDVLQINGTAPNVHVPFPAVINGVEQECKPLKEVIAEVDVVAVVAPINMQQQIVGVAGDKPVIIAKNRRVRVNEAEFNFEFEGWERLIEIKVVTEPFA